MAYVKLNINEELNKAARGKKTKISLPMLLHAALNNYRAIQLQVAKHFSIYER